MTKRSMYEMVIDAMQAKRATEWMTAREIWLCTRQRKTHWARVSIECQKPCLDELVESGNLLKREREEPVGRGGDRRSVCRYKLQSTELALVFSENPHSDDTDLRGIWWSVANRALQKRFGWKEATVLAMCGLRISQLDHELGPTGDGELRISTPGAGWSSDGARGPLETLARPLAAIGVIGKKRVRHNPSAWLELLGADFVIQGRFETNKYIDEVRELLANCVAAIDDYNARTEELNKDQDKVTAEGAPVLFAEPVASREKRFARLCMTAEQFKNTMGNKLDVLADRIRRVESWAKPSQESSCPSSSPTLSTSQDTRESCRTAPSRPLGVSTPMFPSLQPPVSS